MIPLQSLMTVTLPSVTGQNPMVNSQVVIRGIEDQVEILNSLQRPKKITFKGSDGKPYIMLCKPKVGCYLLSRYDQELGEFHKL